jgi:high-affinity nickel-transport protein
MEQEIASLAGFFLLFLLGVRHGLDPDHIAIIDAMTYRSLEQRPYSAPWIGTLFALGHGLAVTGVSVVVSIVASGFAMPAGLAATTKWVPVAMLLLIGTLNLRALLREQIYTPAGWKTRFLPQRLRQSSHPAAVFCAGVLFALVFDTATQAAAWGAVVSAQPGPQMALLIGLVFTSGMVLTDTLDGRLMCQLLKRASSRSETQTYRRRIGWVVVFMAYGVAFYSIAAHWMPAIELSDAVFTATGIGFVLAMLAGYVRIGRSTTHQNV